MRKLLLIILFFGFSVFTAGCDNSGGNTQTGMSDTIIDTPEVAVTAALTTVSGNAVDALVIDGNVQGFLIDNAGALTESVSDVAVTDADGLFNLGVESTSPVLAYRLTGGYYTDDATGETVYLDDEKGHVLYCYVADYQDGVEDQRMITPITSFAAAFVRYQMREYGSEPVASITKANELFHEIYQIDIDTTYPHPMDRAGEVTEITDEYKAGVTLAGISHLAKIVSDFFGVHATSMDVVMAIVRDIEADGVNDGRAGSEQIFIDAGEVIPLAYDTLRWGIPLSSLQYLQSDSNVSTIIVDDLLGYFQEVSLSAGTLFSPIIRATEIEMEDVVPVIAKITGHVENCTDGEVWLYDYTNREKREMYVLPSEIDSSGFYESEFINYSGTVFIEADCTSYYEFAADDYVNPNYSLTAVIDVDKGVDVVVDITPFSSMIEAYYSFKSQFGRSSVLTYEIFWERHFSIDFSQTGQVSFDSPSAVTASFQYRLLLAAMSQLARYYPRYIYEDDTAEPTEITTVDLVNTFQRDISDGSVDGMELVNDVKQTIYVHDHPFSKYTFRHLIGRAAIDIINSDRNNTGVTFDDTIDYLLAIALDSHILFAGSPKQIDQDSPLIIYSTPSGTYINGQYTVTVTATDISGIEEFVLVLNGQPLYDTDTNPAIVTTEIDTTQFADGEIKFLITSVDLAGNTTVIDNYSLFVLGVKIW